MIKHVVIAEFDAEQKEGWVSVSKNFDKVGDAQAFYADCVKDTSCVRAVLEIRRIYTRA